MTCINCHSSNTELYQNDDGNWCKKCDDCDYDWGPFTETEYGQNSSQSTLFDF